MLARCSSWLRYIGAVLLVILLWIALGDSSKAQGDQPTTRQLLDQANEALMRAEVERYGKLLRLAWLAGGGAKDRAEAGADLATYLWRIKNDRARAKAILAPAIALEAKTALPRLGLVRLERFEADFSAALSSARAALAEAGEPLEIRNSRTAFALAVAERVVSSELGGNGHDRIPGDEATIREAFEMMNTVINEEPGVSTAARLHILLALLVEDGPAALRGWHSYYHIPAGSKPPPPFTEPANILDRTLPTFSATSNSKARQEIVDALAGSRLFPEAAVLALRWKLPQSAETQDLILYARWTRQLSRSTNEEYRQQALGKGDNQRLQKNIESQCEALWSALKWPARHASFSMKQFTTGMGARFGALIRTYPGNMNFGHRVREEDHRVEQYGHSTVMRYIELDSMVSNGYTSWLWDGRASVGGWAYEASKSEPATIIRVRTDGAIAAWNSITDPAAIRRNQESLERFAKEEAARANANPYGFLPGLSLRMALNGRYKILEELKVRGLIGADLRSAFISEYERVTVAASIFAHEGRHALDRTDSPLGFSGVDREFRAKLSEVAFAPEPLLAMGAIFSSNIGVKGDNHGMANERIMKGLVTWMEAHKSEIHELDPSHPLLPQFDRLTDEQMRAAFRSMDPWAKAQGS